MKVIPGDASTGITQPSLLQHLDLKRIGLNKKKEKSYQDVKNLYTFFWHVHQSDLGGRHHAVPEGQAQPACSPGPLANAGVGTAPMPAPYVEQGYAALNRQQGLRYKPTRGLLQKYKCLS